ncbi:LAME_0C03752g1_1 [Lachancea meyersii CBS 8951]|uniref:Chromosome segregation in meiosis protein n=1 Tax=Lachancea meyersii CBS 8951 TaxID=1266667 RepID=A0A1G4J0S5_9SACH|nr:LAME_0C03752g1_1 [Lachancea meyersii CBS 8951]
MSQQLIERFSQGPQEDPDSSLPLDPTAINSTGLDDPQLSDPTAITARTRRPQVKLTAEKLCSAKGLPKVMKEAPKRIRISKRRSSYENLTQFLQFYQLWANDLFPKAKFHDFVAICRTLGKTDRELREYRIELLRQELGIWSVGEPELELEPEIQHQDSAPVLPNNHLDMPPSDPPSPREPSLFVADANQNSSMMPNSDDEMIYDRSHATQPTSSNALQQTQEPAPLTAQSAENEADDPPEFSDSEINSALFHQITNQTREDDHDEDEDELALMREFGM